MELLALSEVVFRILKIRFDVTFLKKNFSVIIKLQVCRGTFILICSIVSIVSVVVELLRMLRGCLNFDDV